MKYNYYDTGKLNTFVIDFTHHHNLVEHFNNQILIENKIWKL